MAYRPRIADRELRDLLHGSGAVLIDGPKACGKTSTARRQAGSEVLMDVDENARGTARVEPRLVLEGATPRLIDEWQLVPEIWNHVRRAVDDRHEPSQFILTGSAVPADDIVRHTGAGRRSRLRMRPMSLFELGYSSGDVSLGNALAGKKPNPAKSASNLSQLTEWISVGGWPGHLSRDVAGALRSNRDYIDEVRRTDIRRVDNVDRDPERVLRLLRSLARNIATEASVSTIAADTGGAAGAIKDSTALEYLASLERLMVVEDQPAWAPHLRSKSILRKSPKRHFVDPSLAVAALRATPERLLKDLELLGLLFESLVVRDLRIYSQPIDGVVYHYRDNTGLEVDAIVETGSGAWAGFEVKLGGTAAIDEAAANLIRFHHRVDTDKIGAPTILGVVVGVGEYAYAREDGIWVIPVTVLGP